MGAALRTAVAEHRGWLLENCNQQHSYYSSFLSEKSRSLSSQSGDLPPSLENQVAGEGGSQALELEDLLKSRLNAEEALLSMSSEALTNAYETSVTEAATTSFGTAGGAVILTLFLTAILN